MNFLEERFLSCKTDQNASNSLNNAFLKAFDKRIFFQISLTFLFLLVLGIEIFFFILFFPFLLQNSFFAFALAFMVVTFFAFIMFKQYLESEKVEKIKTMVQEFVDKFKTSLNETEPLDESTQIAAFCNKLAMQVHNREYSYYQPILKIAFIAPFFEKVSCYLHWKDLHLLKEFLLLASIEEYLKMVRIDPTSLEIHAALANAYVMLSGLYFDPRKTEGYDQEHWIPPGKYNETMNESFKWAAERAIEEFKILKEYAPNDPWVYTQLAYSYRDLKMPKKEMEAYEAIVKLRPHDYESLFKLGMLYFRQGENALGLKVYQELKKAHFKKSEMLMSHYGESN